MRDISATARLSTFDRIQASGLLSARFAKAKKALLSKGYVGLVMPGKRARGAEYQRTYRVKRPGVLQRLHRQKLYGIDRDDPWYEKTLAEQGGVCAICKCPETLKHAVTGEVIALAVDHDKDTGQLRGILCKSCNTSIGAMKHSIPILRAAIAYLERHAGNLCAENPNQPP